MSAPEMEKMESGKPYNQFASDNYAGICPEAWKLMEMANRGFEPSYGDDRWTDQACRAIRDLFETDLPGIFRIQRHCSQFACARLALSIIS